MYVVALDASRNEVVLGEEGRQMASVLYADEVNFLSVERPRAAIAVQAKIRYQAPPAQAVLTPLDDGRVRWILPGRSVRSHRGRRLSSTTAIWCSAGARYAEGRSRRNKTKKEPQRGKVFRQNGYCQPGVFCAILHS